MFHPRHYTTCLLLLLFLLALSDFSMSQSQSPWAAKKKRMKEKVRNMFYHAYDNYMTYAFPHDELKPISKTFTNSLSELGNLKLEHLPQDYNGSALTLIESLSSLVIMGNNTEFERAVLWLSENLTFDVDARINLFECNIRVLGGLVSAHLLLSDSSKKLLQGAYNNQLLVLAEDLGKRFLPAFNTPTGLPYAWINLKYGVMENETTETSTSGCGSLILEMGALSKMTGDPIYESVALRALRKLWSMQSSLKLFGTTLDVATGQWIEYSSGIGAGVDSFYEYLLKAHILFGKEDFWKMFHSAYVAVQKYFRHGAWYHEADMRTGRATYWQLTSLQAFWPGLQVLIGDVMAANSSHREFFHVWKRYGVLPERYLLDHQMIHPTEKYYPLRPELAESTFYLYQATKGHPLPVLSNWHEELPEAYVPTNWTFVKRQPRVSRISSMSLQVCPALNLKSGQHIESACHIPDARSDFRCLTDEDCGVDATTCRRRSCSMAGFCGLWLFR
ncbi:alpha-mannosidase I MNS5 isoform X2 [Vigna radiata var. radiata]|uniref:alpha-1,2-Mannosidase n=1 Tax=Vigna radiata var. radiata TaxID=3916 RepID=A0A3Q0F5H4_VIGRR|nr:alpha-mannosidase I MNS5 isoform X2 [Vigna radiata var. radiata]